MGVLTRDRFLRSFLAVFLTATLVVSMVPTPALAAVASRGLDGAAGVAQGQPSSEESSPQGETVGAVSPSAPADPSKPDEAWGQGSGSAWWAGAAEDGSVGTSSSSRDGATNDPLGESVPEESYADALERSVIEGTDLLSAALSSAPHDANNPHTKVEVGKYAPGTYTVTANLFIPASRNPFSGAIQTYMTNPENPLGIVEPDNGDPGAVTGGVPTFHVEKNATLTVGEDDSLTLTVPIRNPVFTLQGIGSGQGAEVVSAHTRAGEYGPRDASGKVTIVGHTSRVDSITFRLSDSGKTTDGSDGYTIQRCSEYPTILNQNWHADLDLTVDLSNVPAPQKYVSDPTVVQDLTYNGHEQQGVTFETNKCDVISGAAAATNAGDYSLTLKPKNGLMWLDGTTDARSLDWKIAEAQGVKEYETIAPCPEDASKTIAAQPLADAVNAGFPYEGLIGSHAPELLGITSQTSDAWNPGTFGHAQLMSEPRVLEPGTYTVTANISMMTPLGFPGYTTNPFNPEGIGGKGGIPNTPVSNNATLTVGADGSRMLSLNLVNPVFTVQNAESSKGVTVEATDRVPIEQKDDDEEYNKAVAADGITSRIAHMTLRLNDWSGSYHFDNWKVYATTLRTFFPNNKYPQIKSLDLSVDISHAQKQVEGDYSKTFTDNATGVSVTVSAEKGTSVIPQLEKASLQVEKIESGMEHDGAKQALTQLYVSAPGFSLYRVLLIADGKPISLDDKTSAEVSIPAARPNAAVYSFRAASLSAVESRMSSGKILFKPSQLGSFVVVDSQGVAKFSWSHTVRDASTGASITYSTDASVEDTLFESAYGPGKGLEALEWYASYMDASGVSSSQAPSSFGEKALSAAKESGSGGWTIAGAYAMGISYSMDGSGVPNNLFDSLSLGYTFTSGINPLSAIVPVASGNASVYAVYGTVGAGATGVKKLSAQITDGYAKVSLNDSDVQIPGLSSMLFHAAAGVGDYTGAPQTAETQIAYLMVVEPSTQKIGEPSVARGLTYSGREQVGVPAGEGYEVSGGAAAAAGDYEATATPRDGYAWADGSVAPRAYRWSIARAPLTAAYAGEEVAEGGTPALRVSVSGFVGGESARTAAGYAAPTVAAPSPLRAGSYELAPAGGAADNYAFSYVAGTLTVLPRDAPRPDPGPAPKPGELAPGTYAVTANLAMPGQYNPVISGLTVYANSPNNPFGPTIDENDPAEVKNEIPSSPLSMNARLVVSADGARTLVLPIKNPIFTTQELGTCEGLSDVRTERVRPTRGGGDWSGSYNRRQDRIHMMSARLPGGAATGVAEFAFRGSVLYAVPLDRELRPSGDVALRLTVDYSSLRRDSDSTELPAFAKGGDTPRPDPRPDLRPVGRPVAAVGLTYSGREQVGVPAGEGYEVSGGAATGAGPHRSTVTLRDGYAWPDGTTAPLSIDWSIAKARLTATYRGEEVAEGEAPALRVDVTGFVGGEGPSTAAGYRAPAVSAPSPLAAGSYELAPSGGAADNYEFAYVGGTLAVRPGGLPRPGSLAPGTYAVTANLAMPGQYNPVISGLTVYANSPNNPFGPTIDENDPAEVKNEIPSSPLSMNARLVVSADGARTLVLPIKNPIFTTQELGTCEGLSDVRTERVRPTRGGGDWSGSYNRRQDRIHMMSARLPGGAATGVAEFAFRGSVLYAVPLDRELRPSGDVALRLTVDYSSLRRDSDSTELPAFAKGGDTPRPDPRPGPDNPNKPNNPSNPNPSPNNPNPSPNNPSNPIPVPNSGKGSGGGISPKDSGDAIRTSNGHLAAGTYTVSANIWVNKATSGLPLQPHFTSAAFPPMNPVSKNATLRVESDGHAYVTVPIVIQPRVMHVLSLTGLDIVRQSYSGEGLSSITVDLGVLRNTDTITKNVTARIRLGSLAKTIIGGNENRTWACTFQVVFNGTSASGGGTIPKAAQDIINAQGKDGRAANSDERARSAADAAMAALDADDGGAAGEDAPAAGSSSAQTTRGRSKGTAEQAAQAAEQLAQGNAGLVAGMVALGIVALGAVAYALHLRRRLKGMGSPPPPGEA